MNQPITVSVGIDWADAKHDFHLITPDGQNCAGVFEQNSQAIAQQIADWRKLCPVRSLQLPSKPAEVPSSTYGAVDSIDRWRRRRRPAFVFKTRAAAGNQGVNVPVCFHFLIPAV